MTNETASTLRKDFIKYFFYTILALMLIPGISLGFTMFAQSSYRRYSRDPIYVLAQQTSTGLLIGGAILLIIIFALGFLAFTNRKVQYVSFITGWRLIVLTCIIELVLQGGLLVWLSYALTAYFFHSYAPKLILVVALMVIAGIFAALVTMFKRMPQNNAIEGHQISRFDAPALWNRIDRIAKKLGTTSPDHIIAGIDTNFFVTESPLSLKGQELKGRILYISLPLLRVLSAEEADGVLAHELNHLRGGDTKNSAKLGPALNRFSMYVMHMYQAAFTRIVYFPLQFYRLIFELALQRESRMREFLADTTAAQTVSPQAIVQSLIKISAYASYRNEIENKLFEQKERHDGQIGIADRIAQGLNTYASSSSFLQNMQQSNIPHPFDSHPRLEDRMNNVNYQVQPESYAFIVTQTPITTWVTDIPGAEQIEKDLWSVYEQAFGEDHERMLAYRFEPENDAEKAIVLKYFPDTTFDLSKGQYITISFRGLERSGEDLVQWDDIKEMKYDDGMGSDVLTLTLNAKSIITNKTRRIKLPGIKSKRNEFKDTLSAFHYRHAVMRDMQKNQNQASS